VDEEEATPGHRIDPALKNDWCDTYLEMINGRFRPPSSYLTSADVECGATSFLGACSEATKAIMPVRVRRAPIRARWWNDSCDNALHDLRRARGRERAVARSRFRAAVRKAKREWATDLILKTPQREVWGLCRWASGRKAKRIPPIRTDSGLAVEPEAQSRAFAQTFFPSSSPHVDISQPDDPPP
jgi:hypothetical protein